MKPDWNENTYQQQFESSLRRGPESRPVPVMTNLRLMDRTNARQIMTYAEEACGIPRYEVESRYDLPLHPSLRAMGRHYFTW
ncbi:hypothetical protein [Occallatibacter savannae]|uniref:hypothetical protein n=1 Tax=Occallatibacter savannae TaxID=1002691 RepID=UPI000D695D62|nr:hypothetical protein [Occallatibacter savannae]